MTMLRTLIVGFSIVSFGYIVTGPYLGLLDMARSKSERVGYHIALAVTATVFALADFCLWVTR